jgi:hypothetical protein
MYGRADADTGLMATAMIEAASRTETRWLGVGSSSLGNAREAGEDAANQALDDRAPALVIVFSTDTYDLEELLAGINARSSGAPLIGCSTSGEIATAGPSDASVVVVALGGAGFSAATAAAENVSTRLREAGAEVASCFGAVDPLPHAALLLLTDGLAGNQQEIVRGAYGVLGAAVPLVGGCAGDGLKMKATYQFHDNRVLTNAVVGAALASEAPLGIGVRHGWRKVGEPMVVTKSGANRVLLLDDEPALDVYLDRLDAPPDVREGAASFTRFALTHPLGMDRRVGEEQIRAVSEADFEERSLVTVAEVPHGGITWLMEGDEQSVLDASDAACADALAQLGGRPPLGMIAFDCVARHGVLGVDGVGREVARIAVHAAGAPVAGFYTYGEIARTRGISGVHNQTLVILAVS